MRDKTAADAELTEYSSLVRMRAKLPMIAMGPPKAPVDLDYCKRKDTLEAISVWRGEVVY